MPQTVISYLVRPKLYAAVTGSVVSNYKIFGQYCHFHSHKAPGFSVFALFGVHIGVIRDRDHNAVYRMNSQPPFKIIIAYGRSCHAQSADLIKTVRQDFLKQCTAFFGFAALCVVNIRLALLACNEEVCNILIPYLLLLPFLLLPFLFAAAFSFFNSSKVLLEITNS